MDQKRRDMLEAESALAKIVAKYSFWDTDETVLLSALDILRSEVKK